MTQKGLTLLCPIHAVLLLLRHLCRRTVVADGDILRLTHTAHHQGEHP
ncbi:MAG: hypothetical protein J6W19_08805 [Prevotella sp.]|nr:hypothetical protein [Prevotella sp.]